MNARFQPKTVAGHLLALLAGALFPLAFSPFDYWPVLILSSAAGFFLCRNAGTAIAAVRGFLFGAGMFGAGTSWVYISIHQFGSASVTLAGLLTVLFVLLLTTLFVMPMFAAYAKLRDHFAISEPWRQAMLFSGLWVLFEWSRSWLLTGFPWLLQGYALLDTPFQSWAPVVGVYGLSLLLVLTATLAVAVTVSDKRRMSSLLALAVMAVVWITSIPLAKVEWTKRKDQLDFSAIQGNIPQDLKWESGFLQETLDTYFGLTQKEWQQDLIIWPENAIPILYGSARSVIQQLDRQASSTGTAMLLGMPVDDNSLGETRYYNGIVALGQSDGRYYKRKLVPFGEYVPLESVLRGLIAFFDLPMSSFTAGNSDQSILETSDTIIAPYICYEVVYPDFAARQARESGLLVTISNDTWFGDSIGPEQHFQMARMRSLETGRYMIRATNDGISALINDNGKVIESIPRFQPGILRGTAKIMTGSTPFMLLSSWPVLLICVLMVFFSFRKKQPV
ncbi:MAG: apolipoprotein N-acyltransferase [Endozoicomonas sp.]